MLQARVQEADQRAYDIGGFRTGTRILKLNRHRGKIDHGVRFNGPTEFPVEAN